MDSSKDNSYSMNRILGLKESITITVGTVIGVGLFTVGANGVGYLGPNVIFATLCAFIASIIPSLLYAEMGSAIPYAGGTYNYASKGLGKVWGMLAGWNFVISLMAVASGEALAFAFYLTTLMDTLKISFAVDSRIIAAIVILLFMYINLKGVEISGKLQNAFMFFFWGVAIVWFISMIGNIDPANYSLGIVESPTIKNFIFTTALIWWCFAGFETCCAMGGEIKFPQINIPRAIKLAPFIVFIVTATFQFFLLGIVPLDKLTMLQTSSAPYADAMIQAGILGFPLIMLCLGIAFGGDFSTLNSCIAAPSRYLYGMAKDGVIPSSFAKIHPKYKTPYFSIIFLGIITIALIYIGDILYVASLSLFADLFYYIIGFFAFIGLRKKYPDLKREYKSPCGILLAVFSIVVYAIMMTELEKDAFITGIIWCAIGVIVFLFFSNKNKDIETNEDPVPIPSEREIAELNKEYKVWKNIVSILFVSVLLLYVIMYFVA